jgi:hypothetical protein
MGASYFRQAIANSISPDARFIAVIQAWADTTNGYTACVLFGFRNDCVLNKAKPTAEEARKRADTERRSGGGDITIKAAEVLTELAAKLESMTKPKEQPNE